MGWRGRKSKFRHPLTAEVSAKRTSDRFMFEDTLGLRLMKRPRWNRKRQTGAMASRHARSVGKTLQVQVRLLGIRRTLYGTGSISRPCPTTFLLRITCAIWSAKTIIRASRRYASVTLNTGGIASTEISRALCNALLRRWTTTMQQARRSSRTASCSKPLEHASRR